MAAVNTNRDIMPCCGEAPMPACSSDGLRYECRVCGLSSHPSDSSRSARRSWNMLANARRRDMIHRSREESYDD